MAASERPDGPQRVECGVERSARHPFGAPNEPGSGALFDLNDDRTFCNDRGIRMDIRGVLLDPFACDLQALLRACLVLANSHRHAALSTTQQRIAQEARDFPEGGFHIGLVLF